MASFCTPLQRCDTPHPPWDPSPKGPRKNPIFSNLPQSKTALPELPSDQGLATVPWGEGGGGGKPQGWFTSSQSATNGLLAPGSQLQAAAGYRLPAAILNSAVPTLFVPG
jgi:hypothetical protein